MRPDPPAAGKAATKHTSFFVCEREEAVVDERSTTLANKRNVLDQTIERQRSVGFVIILFRMLQIPRTRLFQRWCLMLLALTSRNVRVQSFSSVLVRRRSVTTSTKARNMTTTPLSSISPQTQAKRVTTQELDACGQRLRAGHLVAFPTETVYGLGCHALDETACRRVFHAKERPLTDPLIVHVNEATDAYKLWEATATKDNSDSLQARVLKALCDAFWPGPLTLVAQASSAVPAVVMAGTGFCAARSPRHATARALIAAADVPLAAPSANKFGHVSPTTAQHVWDDLKGEDVWILEHDEDERLNSDNVGVESSVAKLEIHNDGKGTLTILRQGAVSVSDLNKALQRVGLDSDIRVVAKSNQRVAEVTATVAPGQNIRHYSPNVPSFLLSSDCVAGMSSCGTEIAALLQGAVILDYGQQLASWKDQVLAYRDLSSTKDSAEAAQWIYDSLRWAEQVSNAQYILFPSLLHDDDSGTGVDALLLAVHDRLTRAASGVMLDSLDTLSSQEEGQAAFD
eukprot:scaffold846_cov168-Amphora_coffeaeformis.AAC.3